MESEKVSNELSQVSRGMNTDTYFDISARTLQEHDEDGNTHISSTQSSCLNPFPEVTFSVQCSKCFLAGWHSAVSEHSSRMAIAGYIFPVFKKGGAEKAPGRVRTWSAERATRSARHSGETRKQRQNIHLQAPLLQVLPLWPLPLPPYSLTIRSPASRAAPRHGPWE